MQLRCSQKLHVKRDFGGEDFCDTPPFPNWSQYDLPEERRACAAEESEKQFSQRSARV